MVEFYFGLVYNCFMNNQFTTTNAQQTQDFACEFSKTLLGGETILLNGDLGAGKTHFVKGVAKGLGIDDVITSPTFALHNQYYGGRLVLNHFDFYRIMDPEEAEILGLNEFFGESDSISCIEWSQNIAELLPRDCIIVTIEKIDENTRQITIQRYL